jgi:hypothetical protein
MKELPSVGDTVWFRFVIDDLARECIASVVRIVDDAHVEVLQPGYNSSKVVHRDDILRLKCRLDRPQCEAGTLLYNQFEEAKRRLNDGDMGVLVLNDLGFLVPDYWLKAMRAYRDHIVKECQA